MVAKSVVILAEHCPAKKVVSSRQMDWPTPQVAERISLRILNAFSQKSDLKKNSERKTGKTTIAIVEDEQDLVSIYSYILKGLGFLSLFIATEGEEIVQAVADGRASPDVIIMDYRLPGMNGIEAAKRILERRPTTKVIVASADDSVRVESISLGFSFLQKPFPMAAFAEMINRVVSQLTEGS